MTAPSLASVQLAFDTELTDARTTSRCPSIVATVSRDGASLCSGATGHLTGRTDGPVATVDSPYRIGSITKTVTAITVLQQVAAGRLDLDAPVGDVLTDLPVDVARTSARALLTHGSGLLAEPSGPWWERSAGRSWAQLVAQIHRNPALIGRFHYSNTGYAILGRLVSLSAGEPWWDLTRRDVLNPLGMDRTTYDRPPNAAPGLAVHPDADLLHDEPTHDTAAMAPAGQLWSTVHDITRLGEFLTRGNSAVLTDQLRERLSVPALIDDVPGQAWTRSYGLGVDITERNTVRYVGHGGSMPGFVASLRSRVADGATVAVFANSTVGHHHDLTYRLLDLFDVRAEPTEHPTTGGPGSELFGRWFWGPRPYTMRGRSGGGLELTPQDTGRGSRFTPTGPDTWVGHDEYFAGETLRVLRAGAVTYLDLGTFRFSRAPYDPGSDIPGGVEPAGWY